MDKIPAGGWVPLAIAVLIMLFMFVWITGRQRSRKGYHEVQVAEKRSFRFTMPLSEKEFIRPHGLSLNEKDIRLAMTPVRWASESMRSIDVADVIRNSPKAHTMSFKDIRVAMRLSRSRSKSTPVGRLLESSDFDTALAVSSKQQEIPILNEECDDMERGASNTADDAKSSGKSLLRSPGVSIFMTNDVETLPIAMLRLASRLGVIPEYVVLCTVQITEDPFVSPFDRVHLCCLDATYKIYQAEIFFGWAEPLSSMRTCKFLKDYAEIQTSESNESKVKSKYRLSALNAKEECQKELIQHLSHLVVEDGLSASFNHAPDLPIVFFVDDTTYKSKSANIFVRALMYAFHFERKIFGVNPVKQYQLPVNNTIEVGTVVFC